MKAFTNTQTPHELEQVRQRTREALRSKAIKHIDDDENVKDMRAVASTIGLTDLLVRAHASKQGSQIKELLRQALRLLGIPEQGRQA